MRYLIFFFLVSCTPVTSYDDFCYHVRNGENVRYDQDSVRQSFARFYNGLMISSVELLPSRDSLILRGELGVEAKGDTLIISNSLLGYVAIQYPESEKYTRVTKYFSIGVGPTIRGNGQHAVVLVNGELWHDPFPGGEGLLSIDYVWLFKDI